MRMVQKVDDPVDWQQVAAPLLKRCTRKYGWETLKAQEVFVAYWQFLKIKMIYEDYDSSRFLPSKSVDQMWREHMVDEANYVKLYALLFDDRTVGRILNGDGEVEAAEVIDERRVATRRALLTHQGELGLEYEEWKDLFESPRPLGTPGSCYHCWCPGRLSTDSILLDVNIGRWRIQVRVPRNDGRVGDLADLIFAVAGVTPSKGISLFYEGRKIDPDNQFYASPRSLGMRHKTVLELIRRAPDREDGRPGRPHRNLLGGGSRPRADETEAYAHAAEILRQLSGDVRRGGAAAQEAAGFPSLPWDDD
jgi:hypothetical protein